MTPKKFTIDFLLKNCHDNNVQLLEDYSNAQIGRETIIRTKCLTEKCIFNVEKTFRCVIDGGFYCKKCTENKRRQKIKETNLKNLGVEHPSQSQEIKNKKKETCLKNLGVENPFQSKEVQEKAKQSCLNKLGVENPSQSKEIKNKKKETCLKNLGVEHPLQNTEIREKIKATNLEKYGCENPNQNKGVREKIKATNLERYGVENPSQNPEILDKAIKKQKKRKTFTFPSGNAISCQGYEPFALKELSQTHQELDIITGCKNVPKLSYKDETGKDHKHFVDIFISSENKCIEVKSTWTAKKKQDCIFLKQESAKSAGYKYEIWIYNPKGEKVECHL